MHDLVGVVLPINVGDLRLLSQVKKRHKD